jgi:hypothetical protein
MKVYGELRFFEPRPILPRGKVTSSQMKIENIGTVIAERELDGQDNGKPCKVIVRFSKPRQFADEAGDDSSWYCPYSIASPKGERLSYAGGVDSLQALRLAIQKAALELRTLYADLRSKWCGENDPGFGPEI